ncbi:MAG: ATP-dependent DNA helicase RecQ [SAR324 cluster bacterium]|nr:ATP-dependent DNA helicase RecQ [SAR324 cluster bacterium]
MPQPKELLQQHFGFSDFRPGQEQVIDTLLKGRSVLAVFPTGSGKSLCFQLPALAMNGLTLVISPLLALMKDQVDFLQSKGIAADRWDSSKDYDQIKELKRTINQGKLKLLYVSPERLSNESFLNFMGQVNIGLLVIDEAHCISEWGHNFRPEYLKLHFHASKLKIAQFLCLTATATPQVAQDICKLFSIAPEDYVLTGFYRPNLTLRHHVVKGGDEAKNQFLLGRLAANPKGATIVYVSLRHTAEKVAELLAAQGYHCKAYHAGIKSDEREAIQLWFMADPEAVVVATIAFGMGVDKADIRYVYHYNLPKNLESYSQEIGRAGRDGQPSLCEVLASPDDGAVLEGFIYGDTPDSQDLSNFIHFLFKQDQQFSISLYDLAKEFDINNLTLNILLVYLELEGYIKYQRTLFGFFKYKLLKNEAEILGGFNADRANFLKAIFDCSDKKATWSYISPEEMAQRIGQPQERIGAALDYLADQDMLELQPSKPRKQYTILQQPALLPDLVAKMQDNFVQKEGRDQDRIQQIYQFIGQKTCKSQYLLDYFGEPKKADCGHCGPCLNETQEAFTAIKTLELTQAQLQKVAQLKALNIEPLNSPRKLARYLTGINSPASSPVRKLHGKFFGALEGASFSAILDAAR